MKATSCELLIEFRDVVTESATSCHPSQLLCLLLSLSSGGFARVKHFLQFPPYVPAMAPGIFLAVLEGEGRAGGQVDREVLRSVAKEEPVEFLPGGVRSAKNFSYVQRKLNNNYPFYADWFLFTYAVQYCMRTPRMCRVCALYLVAETLTWCFLFLQ